MKIIIVSTHPTHPTIEGNRTFILNQVELFKSMGHDVYFLLICINGGDWVGNPVDVLNQMKDYWGSHLFIYKKGYLFFKRRELIKKFRKITNGGYLHCDDMFPNGLDKYLHKLNSLYSFDCCIANYYILSKLILNSKIHLNGLVTHDYFGYKNLLTGEKNVWLGTTPDQEAKALQRCTHIFALNTEEAAYFSKLSPQSVIYNVFSVYKYRRSEYVGNHKLLFLSGNNKYNQNGLKWFLKEIFPAIIQRFPDCVLEIGGGICNVLKGSISDSHVKLLGYVDSTVTFYDRADIVINPTFQGTGLKIKTFEGISNGKIVMTHPHSLIGIYRPDIAPVFSSEVPNDWVDYLESLWNNNSNIFELKKQCKIYIDQMNDFVKSEYRRFFS